MKVICAGFPKTGTKSLARALRILGYEVYDYKEAIQFAYEDWERILLDKSTDVNGVLDKIYSNGVEAVTDTPHSIFFEHFYRKWPDAKVILMVREENAWFHSFKQMLEDVDRKHPIMSKVVPYISKSSRGFWRWHHGLFTLMLGTIEPNKLKWTLALRRHNAYVKQTIPEKKLLIYDVSSGWSPLCEFLDKKIPEEDFPFENKAGTKDTIGEKIMDEFEIIKKIKKEVIQFMLLLSITLVFISIMCI